MFCYFTFHPFPTKPTIQEKCLVHIQSCRDSINSSCLYNAFFLPRSKLPYSFFLATYHVYSATFRGLRYKKHIFRANFKRCRARKKRWTNMEEKQSNKPFSGDPGINTPWLPRDSYRSKFTWTVNHAFMNHETFLVVPFACLGTYKCWKKLAWWNICYYLPYNFRLFFDLSYIY